MSDRRLRYCHYCGTQAENPDQKFCTNCGAKLPENDYSTSYGTEETENPFGSAFDSVDNSSRQSDFTQPRPKMKWYFFLVYFILIISAFNNILSGFEYITGNYYTVETASLSFIRIPATELYATYGTIYRLADIFFGIGMIAVGAFAIYTHQSLKKFRKKAPKTLTLFYILTGAVQLLYFIVISSVTGEAMMIESFAVVISAVFWILINRSYFKKREHLFVN